MASLSVEEENYVRMSLFLTGISPRAARTLFDSEFPPASLYARIMQEYNKLLELKKKHIVNQSQWNLLFPIFPDVPDSKKFDVTLMTLLLRNLTPMTPPLCGFDRLPSSIETTPAADLARIKHYRNHLAHLDDGKLDTRFFNTAWNDLTCAIDRLGGRQVKLECDHLKTKPLDQTNQEIMMGIKHSNKEIRELKESFESLIISHELLQKHHKEVKKSNDMLQEDYTEIKTSHKTLQDDHAKVKTSHEILRDDHAQVKTSHEILQDDHAKVKTSHEILQDDHAKVKTSHEILQDDHRKVTNELEKVRTSQEDTVPWNIRERINDTLKDWKENDEKMYINTRAAQYVLKCIKKNSCVTITASSGVGKTATLRHVALQMAKEEFDVLPVTDPAEIVRFCNPKKKTLFVVDDLCGNFSLDQSDLKSWERTIEDIKTNLEKKQTKILAACRLQVYQDVKFNCLSVFKSCVCNMLSDNICLSQKEKQLIANLYLNAKASKINDFYDIYDCFPLLCKLYHDNPKIIITDFFQNPYSIYQAEIDNFLSNGLYAKYCALALCVVFNNKLKEDMLTKELNKETRIIIENTCEACRLDRGTSRLVLQDELDALTHTFIKKEQNMYKIIHDKIFDFLAKIYGQKIIDCLIKNADCGLIKERFLLEKKEIMDPFITILPPAYHEMYIQRMIDDWSKGKVQDVFSNINMKIDQFRQKFFSFLKSLDISDQKRLANICDEGELCRKSFSMMFKDDNTYDTCLLHCCSLGYTSLVKWCCGHVVNVNMCTYNGQSPIMIACKYGHTEIVKMLLYTGADYDKFDRWGHSPLLQACEHGHTVIAKMLLDRGADYNKCDSVCRESPIMQACKNGHIEIVKILLEKGEDYNKCNWFGVSPIMKACKQGHTEIVKMLLNIGATYTKHDNWGRSTLMYACEHGRTEIVKMLLVMEVDCNKCDRLGQSPIMMACKHDHTEIVNMLLDKLAASGQFDDDGVSRLIKACELGHTEIVKMLFKREKYYELYSRRKSPIITQKLDKVGREAIMLACKHGHKEIVKILIDRGTDCYKCDSSAKSPVMMIACEHGHTEIVKLLLNRGADYKNCDMNGHSSVSKACQNGHTEIVKMLLNREAVYTFGLSPVMQAFEHGHTEIVKVLLEKVDDFSTCYEVGHPTLMYACEHGHTDIVKILLDRGADCDKFDEGDKSPLNAACKNFHTEIVKMLLVKGADYNICGQRSCSPTISAFEHDHTEIIKMFLDGRTRCMFGLSPVIQAFKHGHIEIVKILLEGVEDFSTCCEVCHLILMYACEHGHTEIVKMLLVRGADSNIYEKRGHSPLVTAYKHGHIEIVKMLIDRGANWNKCDKRGYSPISTACEHGHIEIVKMLTERGADLNTCDKRGHSPLIMACKHGRTEIVKRLLDGGADINRYDNDGQLPIIKACKKGNKEIVEMLLDRGADFNKYDEYGQLPLIKACKHGHTEIVEILLDRAAGHTKCASYCVPYLPPDWELNQTDIVDMLLNRGSDYYQFKDKQIPIITTKKRCHKEIKDMLYMFSKETNYDECNSMIGSSDIIRLGNEADYNKSDVGFLFSIMYACKYGHTEIVKMLLDRLKDYTFGMSLVKQACKDGHTEIVNMLLDRGVECNECDLNGRSSLMEACEHGHKEIVKMLLDKGADFNRSDRRGQSLIMKACEHGHTEIVKLLLDKGAVYNKSETWRYKKWKNSFRQKSSL